MTDVLNADTQADGDIIPPAVDPQGVVGKPFTTLMLVEGLETSDGRMFERGETSWRDLPWPLMVQDSTSHGPGQAPAPAWPAGQIEQVERDPADPTRILGRGHLLPNEDGARAEELARHSFRGVSVDAYGDSPVPDVVQVTAVDQNGNPIGALIRYSNNVLSRLTMVPTPALECCCLWFDDEEPPQRALDAHGADIPTDTPPEVVTIADPYEQLVASGGGPLTPPRSWFFTPEPDHYQPLETTPDGHVTGHLGPEGQCHIGNVGRCDTIPMSNTVPPYKSFHRTIARCEDGPDVACGWLTIDTKHEWDMRATAEQTADHYDHTGTLAAKIRVSNGQHGPWASGSLLPGLDDRTLAILQGPEVSGDWRRWQDPDTQQTYALELQGVLGVPFPAFPGTRTRPELLIASGQVVAQFGHLDPCDCDGGDPMTPEEQATIDARFAALEAKYDALALVAAGGAPVPAVAGTTAVTSGSVTLTDSTSIVDQGVGAPDIAAEVTDEAEPEPVALSASERGRYLAKYDTAARKAMVKDGRAMLDGSYPIGDVDDLDIVIRNAGDNQAFRRHATRNATLLGTPDRIPADWSNEPVATDS